MSNSNQFVSIGVNEHLMGIDIRAVREITTGIPISTVWGAAPHIRGLINLRGQIITVIELGVAMRIQQTPQLDGDTSHLIVLRTTTELEACGESIITHGDQAALLVQHVGDVIECTPDKIGPPPPHLHGIGADFLTGVYRLPDTIMGLLNLNRILTAKASISAA